MLCYNISRKIVNHITHIYSYMQTSSPRFYGQSLNDINSTQVYWVSFYSIIFESLANNNNNNNNSKMKKLFRVIWAIYNEKWIHLETYKTRKNMKMLESFSRLWKALQQWLTLYPQRYLDEKLNITWDEYQSAAKPNTKINISSVRHNWLQFNWTPSNSSSSSSKIHFFDIEIFAFESSSHLTDILLSIIIFPFSRTLKIYFTCLYYLKRYFKVNLKSFEQNNSQTNKKKLTLKQFWERWKIQMIFWVSYTFQLDL